MSVRPLGREYEESEPDAQHYAELSYRAPGLQVSVYAIPDAGMRLSWRYTPDAGDDVAGNSSQDSDLTRDETPVPHGPFQVRLQLRKKAKGVEASAFLNGASEPFARKFLEGFQGHSAQVAVGCRNLACSFKGLVVQGAQTERRAHNVAETKGE